ncbi:peptidase [Stachybotrys elegans]|uniref:Probable dipeptidyl-aminopeptidase B n=1 Tax=Stachybotrys elegans TaxID=80388 RepID=A0A8K0SD02_9HYPO|nr:peptidase [Stachybotrys elegans]
MVSIKSLSALRGAALLLATAWTATVAAKPDLDRSVSLRADWMYLTRDIPDLPQWSHAGKRFHYRKTVDDGFAFVEVFACSLRRRDPFDAVKLASTLSQVTGTTYQALRLPFETFSYVSDGDDSAISVSVAGSRWTCTIGEGGEAEAYACVRPPSGGGAGNRPRGFGVVRDLTVPANNPPRRSPNGAWEVFVENDNVVLRAARSNDTPRPLSSDGTADNFYDPETIVWSPDSTKLVVYRVKPGYARQVVRVEAAPTSQKQPIVRTQLYPKPGDDIDQEQPVLFYVDEELESIEIDADLFPTPWQLSRPVWRRDSSEFVFDYQRRGHSQARVISVDGATGTPRAIVTEEADTFVYADRRWRYDVGDGSREMLWISERDGWRHLYLVGTANGTIEQITKGDWLVRDVIRVDEQRRLIWFSANGIDVDEGKDPYFKHFFRIGFNGSNLTRLTTADASHELTFSPDSSLYVDTYSRVDLPTISELHRADGSLIGTIETGDISRLTDAGFRAPEVFVAKGRDNATDIWGLIVRPYNYDPDKTYQVIENIYAGPHDSFVPKTFWPFGYHSGGDKVIGMQAQADLGFIVVQMDGMGTANRNKAFHDVAWKDLADSGFPDRILWHRAVAAQDPSYDISGGVGIYGASAGGQSSLNALLFHGDFYRFAVAYAGCYDNRMDKISWNEQWLGWPVDESYSAASGVDHADKLKGQILLISGEQDSNVDPASTMQVVDALVRADKDFELLIVPGGEHTVGRSTEPIDYVQRRQFDFFVRKMLNKTAI